MLSILRNEFIWNVDGVHDLDVNGHAKIALDHVKIQFNDNNTLTRVGNIVMASRIKNYDLYFEPSILMVWVRKPTLPSSLYSQYTLLQIEEEENVHYTKSPDFELSTKKHMMLACVIDWDNIPLMPKLIHKTEEIEYKKPVIETIDEIIMEKMFDNEKQKYILKMNKTGKTIDVHKTEVLQLYDIDGNYIEDKEVKMYETTQVQNSLYDENHNILQEIDIDNDGNNVMIPIYEVKTVADGSHYYLLPCIKFNL